MNEAVDLQFKSKLTLKWTIFWENFENMAYLMLESDKTNGRLGNQTELSYLASLFNWQLRQECSVDCQL